MNTIGGTPFHLTAAAAVDSGPGGILHTVTIGTGAAGTLTLYDGTDDTGSVISIITVAASAAPVTLTFDAELGTGLYAGVADGLDVTVVILPAPGYND